MNRVKHSKGRTDHMISLIEESQGSYSPLQLYFLSRLSRLLGLRGEQSGEVNREGLHLIDRAIYSTYCDAVDAGIGQEAQRLLHGTAVASRSAAGEN